MLLDFSHWVTYEIFKLSEGTRLAAAVEFFIYDTIKILFLLTVLMFIVGVLRTFLPKEKIKKWMTRRGGMGNVFAAMFGAVTPFCSCSSIPLFLSFLEAGIPLGVTFSFLITSPLINEYLVVLMIGFFGWKIAVAYVVGGLIIGVISGMILGKMNLDQYLVQDLIDRRADLKEEIAEKMTFMQRLQFGWSETALMVKKIWVWIIVGVGAGALIHNYVPQEAVQGIIESTGVFSVPLAVILGVPMYGSCAAIVPIAVVLFQKGIPLGTALAFMMAIAALSLPEAVMLRRAMKLQLILLFFGITTISIIVIGYVFNILQNILM